ncbi:putative N-acetyltransferase YhbS [Dongia mobilis]|uniref:Putative N-acetyltransferase YhbS n=1 Tax=Dongia mobilis TaxID=578943 RepID=A0A4R6WKG8_9PROT|nr:GNAT family N-acetyltransferase [Dongia mobilis]TDQ80907.1 putative N-acetyltransferase YhbS [Dongia mobilis]
MTIQIRSATATDAIACGRIAYEAFAAIAGTHGFPYDFPSAEAAQGLAADLVANPDVYGVVAEQDGMIVGSNFLMEDDEIRGVGPITVDPRVQGSGIGRRLMEEVLQRAAGARGIRLLQDSFNMRSIALYASLGFAVREPVLLMRGRPMGDVPEGVVVRPMDAGDVEPCDVLCRRAHGISRRNEILAALRRSTPLIAMRDGQIVAYMTAPEFWIGNHGVAAAVEDMQALVLGAAKLTPLSFLLPTRQEELFRWCLAIGMQAVKPMTLMSIGDYREPEQAYMPSVFY